MTRVLVLFADGLEEIEAVTQVDVLRRAGIKVDVVSTTGGKKVLGAHKLYLATDVRIEDLSGDYDGIVVPGGMVGVNNLKGNPAVLKLLNEGLENGALIAAICAGPLVLAEAGILKDRKVTCYPGLEKKLGKVRFIEESVVIDKNIITSRGPATAMLFGLSIVEYLLGDKIRGELEADLLVHN